MASARHCPNGTRVGSWDLADRWAQSIRPRQDYPAVLQGPQDPPPLVDRPDLALPPIRVGQRLLELLTGRTALSGQAALGYREPPENQRDRTVQPILGFRVAQELACLPSG